jgi:hypothetical protein
MKLHLVMLALVCAIAVPAATAAPSPNNQSGGAAGLVAAVVQLQDTLNDLTALNNTGTIKVVEISDSLNNVLQNASFLNNITILQDFLNQPDCSVIAVCDSLNNVLNENNVAISDVVAVDLLSGGDINVFVQPQ